MFFKKIIVRLTSIAIAIFKKRFLFGFLFSLLVHMLIFSEFYLTNFRPTVQANSLPSLAIRFRVVPVGSSFKEKVKASTNEKNELKVANGLQKSSKQKKETKGEKDGDKEANEVYIHESYEEIVAIVHNALIYPMQARARGYQGRVVISFSLTPQGEILDIVPEESSGYAVLDQSAIKTIQSLRGFPLPSHRVRMQIPIVYVLRN